MRQIWILIGAILLAYPSAASAEPELRVNLRTEQLHETRDLGTVEVPGVGAVSLVAQRKGPVIVLRATGPDGTPLGRAETNVGLSESPIYVRTPNGLTKISVVWNSPD